MVRPVRRSWVIGTGSVKTSIALYRGGTLVLLMYKSVTLACDLEDRVHTFKVQGYMLFVGSTSVFEAVVWSGLPERSFPGSGDGEGLPAYQYLNTRIAILLTVSECKGRRMRPPLELEVFQRGSGVVGNWQQRSL